MERGIGSGGADRGSGFAGERADAVLRIGRCGLLAPGNAGGCAIVETTMNARDTTARAGAIAAALNRSAGPASRFQQALELSDLLREMAKAGLRARHPEYSDEELLRALTLQLHRETRRQK